MHFKPYQAALVLIAVAACVKNERKKDDPDKSPQPEGTMSTMLHVLGSLADTALALVSGVSHVVAMNTETGDNTYASIGTDGSFTLNLYQNKPWFISYIDNSKTGTDMLVSVFTIGTLDTLVSASLATSIDMGHVNVADDTATMSLSYDNFLVAAGISSEAATTLGANDDVARRYSNPDIDGNGLADAIEGKSYLLNFHNRFTVKKADGSELTMADLKNAFYPDDAVFAYAGSKILAQIPKTDLDGTAPATYIWSFNIDMTISGDKICDGRTAGDTLLAGTSCALAHTSNTGAISDKVFAFTMDVASLQAGNYTLKAGGKTYEWQNIAVPDFSTGKGFLILSLRIDVDTGTNRVKGLSYQWQKRNDDESYSPASDEDLKLIVKSYGGDSKLGAYVSLVYKGDASAGSIGVKVPKKSEGSLVFSSELSRGNDSLVTVQGSVLSKQMLIDGITFTDLGSTKPTVVYDDRLGMHFSF